MGTQSTTAVHHNDNSGAARKLSARTARAACSSAAVALACLALGTANAADTHGGTYQLDIPAQNLGDALQALALASQHKLLSLSQLVEGRSAPAIKGAYTIEQAVQRLLTGTDLIFEVSDGLVLIRAKDDKRTAPAGAYELTSSSLLTADGPEASFGTQAHTRAAAARTRVASLSDGSGAASAPARESGVEAPRQAGGGGDRIELEEILVTGTHIRGAQEVPMPVMVFTREEIEKTGYSRVEDLMRSIPQNLAGVTAARGAAGRSLLSGSNSDRATGVDLRGLGPQSTLTLLNGQRRAGAVLGRVVDVSAIPFSAIERVEVVTGGRSAIYGSDAVAGVVNFVTRRDFEGSETTAYYGESDAGGERLQLSQIYGRRGERGGFVATYDYSDSSPLDAWDAGVVRGPSPFGLTPIPEQYYQHPEDTRHSTFLSGRYSIGSTELYADALYSSDDNFMLSSFEGFGRDFIQSQRVASDQFSVAPGMRITLSDHWGLNVSGVHSGFKSDTSAQSPFGTGESALESELSSISAVLDGLVASSEAVEVRSAVGAEHRREGIEYPSSGVPFDLDRTVDSIFAEALVSMLPSSAVGHRLQASLAARYSDYSDFGDSFDPQLGLSFNTGVGLTLRAAYSTAFRAPDLHALNENFATTAILIDQPDAQLGGAPVPTLIWVAQNAGLQPEEAETWSAGLDYEPEFAPGLRLSVSYFDIQYDERIDAPALGQDRFTVLLNEDRYAGLIDRSPSAELLQAILDRAGTQVGVNTSVPFDPSTQSILEVFPNLVLFDNRINNVATESMRGIDAMLSGVIDHGSGRYSFGLNGVYYIEFERRLTKTSPAIAALNAPGKIVDFRLRANAGWEGSFIGASVFLNYVDSYENTLVVPSAKIDSWTTVDATLRFFGSGVKGSGLLDGLTATLAVQNLFDRAPPDVAGNSVGVRYDPANADALGRFVSLSLVKKW